MAAKKSDSIDELAQEFGVSAGLVRRACREFGVTSPKNDDETNTIKLSPEHVVADLRAGKSPTEVARQYQVPERKILHLQTQVVAGGTTGKRR